jgi:hypothetical protein
MPATGAAWSRPQAPRLRRASFSHQAAAVAEAGRRAAYAPVAVNRASDVNVFSDAGTTFKSLGLEEDVCNALDAAGFTAPANTQVRTLRTCCQHMTAFLVPMRDSCVLARAIQMLAAETGKTLAFLLHLVGLIASSHTSGARHTAHSARRQRGARGRDGQRQDARVPAARAAERARAQRGAPA